VVAMMMMMIMLDGGCGGDEWNAGPHLRVDKQALRNV